MPLDRTTLFKLARHSTARRSESGLRSSHAPW
ncbi:Uncharacterised protein [Vibrio cholerae]|nr:Uncharacterised protein [Vibrio cholerae]